MHYGEGYLRLTPAEPLLDWASSLASPKFVDQHRAHRVNIYVAIEFEASVPIHALFEREPPVVIVEPCEPILTTQRPATAQPSQLSFEARAHEPTVAVFVQREPALGTTEHEGNVGFGRN